MKTLSKLSAPVDGQTSSLVREAHARHGHCSLRMDAAHHGPALSGTWGHLLRLALPVLAVIACCSWSRPASAETTLGLHTHGVAGVRDNEADGVGMDLTLGRRLNLAVLVLETELAAGYQDLGGPQDPTIYRLVGGGRIGLGVIIRPSLFAHLGVARVSYDDPSGRDSLTGFTSDFGAALDFTPLPLLDIGLHVAYSSVAAAELEDSLSSVLAGGHLVLVF